MYFLVSNSRSLGNWRKRGRGEVESVYLFLVVFQRVVLQICSSDVLFF
jgi:hypothetical protein